MKGKKVRKMTPTQSHLKRRYAEKQNPLYFPRVCDIVWRSTPTNAWIIEYQYMNMCVCASYRWLFRGRGGICIMHAPFIAHFVSHRIQRFIFTWRYASLSSMPQRIGRGLYCCWFSTISKHKKLSKLVNHLSVLNTQRHEWISLTFFTQELHCVEYAPRSMTTNCCAFPFRGSPICEQEI